MFWTALHLKFYLKVHNVHKAMEGVREVLNAPLPLPCVLFLEREKFSLTLFFSLLEIACKGRDNTNLKHSEGRSVEGPTACPSFCHVPHAILSNT